MKLKAEGPTEEDLIKYKAVQKTGLEKVAKENGFWLTYINGRLMNGETIDISELKNSIKNITKENIQALAQKLLSNENYIRIVLVPEK
jgi:zinc protease